DRARAASGRCAPRLRLRFRRVPAPGWRVSVPARVRILGIDPGSVRTGWGVVDADATGRCTHVANGALAVGGGEDFALRLKAIFDGLRALLAAHAPQEVAIERVFLAKNPDSALKLGQARGAAICAAVSVD